MLLYSLDSIREWRTLSEIRGVVSSALQAMNNQSKLALWAELVLASRNSG